MRLRATFKIVDEQLEYGYQMGVVSLIKEALKRSSESYFKRLYEKDHTPKPFCFATFLHEPVFHSNNVSAKKISITISSFDHEFLLHFHNGLVKLNEHSYKNSIWTKERIQLLSEKEITSSTVTFRTLSPLLIEDKNGNPLSPQDTTYEREINYYASLTAKEFLGRTLYAPLKVKNHRMKKTVVKMTNSKWEKHNDGFLYFTGYRGLIRLDGRPEDLNMIYQIGLSKRRSQSFGLLDVYHQI
ncbi:CRISPR-associated endoribonuclease Cas6 [Aliibacillus thermotolerans]|uniref:CRISPR-associated endoribonuclease Cas6 n=1 Tax=Aliibacillus thermotolerans TaxID=1834418 RepID=A0ABW0U7X8_9BACI|nr:CRISPR-associated endoribonuclease Cas6 [Aliibacillus thermotolerans]MDA3129375.1 CRISPR-associated endoribonuclease Cas6 [Aliibacillus thermotolerans]